MTSLLKRVIAHMERIAPLSLADRSWGGWAVVVAITSVRTFDTIPIYNVGVLLESPALCDGGPPRSTIFLAIDLTPAVLEEALADPSTGVIVAYHPPIFRGLKRLTLADPKQAILMQCCQRGVSIYSPHTALDACAEGINDWLVKAAGPLQSTRALKPCQTPPTADMVGQEGAGMGRTGELLVPQTFETCVASVKRYLGLKHVRTARADNNVDGKALIRTVAVCAGSGSSVLADTKADLYITGEMSHHEVLAAVADNINVILCEHTNSERGYLAHLAKKLQASLAVEDPAIRVVLSKSDRDPIEIV